MDDLNVLRRAGVLRPLGPKTAFEVSRQVLREGIKAHLIYTIHGTRDPNKPALITEHEQTTWWELLDRVRRLANHFIDRGVKPGGSVAIMLPNIEEFIEANGAAIRIGARASYLNPRMPEGEAKAILERTGADLLVTHRDDMCGEVPVLHTGDEYEAAIALASSREPRIERSAHGNVVVFTSGTTGRPKGAVRSLDDGASPSALSGFLRTIPFRSEDIHMVICPLYHSSGSGFATIAQVLGNPLVLVERFSPEAFCRHVQEFKVTTTTVVPTMLHQLAAWPGARDYDLTSLRVVVCTGSPLREKVRAEARALLGDVLYDLYGSTEMGWVSVARPEDQAEAPGTVGRPVPGVEVRVLDSDGRRVPIGERGEIWVKSSLGMKGYMDDPELEHERMKDGFISVRDVGYIDEDGFLHVVDRADDMIISGGVNVYPAETEVALNAHPKVDESAVLGVDDPKWGQRVVAAVVASEQVSEEELIDWCKRNAAYAAVPKEIRTVASLPRNDIGKVDKKKIAADWETNA
ncbi:MAG: AMP-binding protein [Actinomycetota bacterium]